jgi:hypothetical protein
LIGCRKHPEMIIVKASTIAGDLWRLKPAGC